MSRSLALLVVAACGLLVTIAVGSHADEQPAHANSKLVTVEAGSVGSFELPNASAKAELRELAAFFKWTVVNSGEDGFRIVAPSGELCIGTTNGKTRVVGVPMVDGGPDGGGVLASLAASWIRIRGHQAHSRRASSWLVTGVSSTVLSDEITAALARRGTTVTNEALMPDTISLFQARGEQATTATKGWIVWIGLYYGPNTIRVTLADRANPLAGDEERILREAVEKCSARQNGTFQFREFYPD